MAMDWQHPALESFPGARRATSKNRGQLFQLVAARGSPDKGLGPLSGGDWAGRVVEGTEGSPPVLRHGWAQSAADSASD